MNIVIFCLAILNVVICSLTIRVKVSSKEDYNGWIIGLFGWGVVVTKCIEIMRMSS